MDECCENMRAEHGRMGQKLDECLEGLKASIADSERHLIARLEEAIPAIMAGITDSERHLMARLGEAIAAIMALPVQDMVQLLGTIHSSLQNVTDRVRSIEDATGEVRVEMGRVGQKIDVRFDESKVEVHRIGQKMDECCENMRAEHGRMGQKLDECLEGLKASIADSERHLIARLEEAIPAIMAGITDSERHLMARLGEAIAAIMALPVQDMVQLLGTVHAALQNATDRVRSVEDATSGVRVAVTESQSHLSSRVAEAVTTILAAITDSDRFVDRRLAEMLPAVLAAITNSERLLGGRLGEVLAATLALPVRDILNTMGPLQASVQSITDRINVITEGCEAIQADTSRIRAALPNQLEWLQGVSGRLADVVSRFNDVPTITSLRAELALLMPEIRAVIQATQPPPPDLREFREDLLGVEQRVVRVCGESRDVIFQRLEALPVHITQIIGGGGGGGGRECGEHVLRLQREIQSEVIARLQLLLERVDLIPVVRTDFREMRSILESHTTFVIDWRRELLAQLDSLQPAVAPPPAHGPPSSRAPSPPPPVRGGFAESVGHSVQEFLQDLSQDPHGGASVRADAQVRARW